MHQTVISHQKWPQKISFNVIDLLYGQKSKRRGVEFIKVGPTVQIIEIALSICALHLRRTITPVKSFSKVGCYALHCAPKFMKSTQG